MVVLTILIKIQTNWVLTCCLPIFSTLLWLAQLCDCDHMTVNMSQTFLPSQFMALHQTQIQFLTIYPPTNPVSLYIRVILRLETRLFHPQSCVIAVPVEIQCLVSLFSFLLLQVNSPVVVIIRDHCTIFTVYLPLKSLFGHLPL